MTKKCYGYIVELSIDSIYIYITTYIYIYIYLNNLLLMSKKL